MLGLCEVLTLDKEPRVVLLNPWTEAAAPVLNDFLRGRTVICHNGPGFDEIAMKQHGVSWTKREDTLIAYHAYASHLPKKLYHVVSVYVDARPWKQIYGEKEGGVEKGGFGVSDEDLNAYNAGDVRLTARAWLSMQADLKTERKTYEFDMRMSELMQRMQMTGILVDQPRRLDLARKLRSRERGLLGSLRRLSGNPEFSPKRYSDIRKAIYPDPRKIFRITPSGKPATNKAVLEALKNQPGTVGTIADDIIRWRSAHDVRVEYLENVRLHTDGRVHGSWKCFGTRTGRPACHKPNLLNTPRITACTKCGVMFLDSWESRVFSHRDTCTRKSDVPPPESQIRDIYIAPKGSKLVYYDLSQAEMRFAAHLSGDAAFMKSCEGDIHAGNAMVLFPDAADILRSDPKGKGKKFRDIAKNCGFAVTYLAEAETVFAYLLAHGFPVTFPDVEAMLGRMKSAYWQYYAWVDQNLRFCQRNGYLRSFLLNRIRWLGWHPSPTEIANTPIQSGVADEMGFRMLELDQRLPKKARLLIYAYDSCTYEVPDNLVTEVSDIIKDVWSRPVFVPHNGISFKQPTDFKVGQRWSDFG